MQESHVCNGTNLKESKEESDVEEAMVHFVAIKENDEEGSDTEVYDHFYE